MPFSPLSTASPNDLIDEIVQETYNGCAKCVYLPPEQGGRRIVTTRKVQLGEIVGRSKNQVTAPKPSTLQQKQLWERLCKTFGEEFVNEGNLLEGEYDAYLVWGALHSLLPDELPLGEFPVPGISSHAQDLIGLHFIPEILDATAEVKKLHSELGLRCTPVKLEMLIHLWNFNCLEHSHLEDATVLSLGFALMNHACMPNTSWEVQGDEVILRATAELDAGDELSITYIEDDHMHKPTKLRQEHIESTGKGFVCGCSRCTGPERCRHVVCPEAGSSGLMSLESLTGAEQAKYLDMESKLHLLLEDFLDEETDEGGDDNIERAVRSPLIAPPPRTQDLHEITPEQLAFIREVATSGKWLAPTGHWLAHQAYGLLKDWAWSQNACPTTILDCLQKRAAFVSQAYPTVAPNSPPFLDTGLELLEAAELLIKGDRWPAAWTQQRRHETAVPFLHGAIGILKPMRGSENCHVRKATKYLSLLEEKSTPPKRGLKRKLTWENVALQEVCA